MGRRSPTLLEKLDNHFRQDTVLRELDSMLAVNQSIYKFNSPDDLAEYLTEGALLNVNTIGSKALSIPCGEYIVWATDAGHTMLVPIGKTGQRHQEVFEHTNDQYEILTRDLLANWNKLERVISEKGDKRSDDQSDSDDDSPEDEPISKIDVSTVDRTALLKALNDRGYTVSGLADKVGVDPPAISRILREPSSARHGDPGGRNPSMKLAAKICRALQIGPIAAFPDIFGTRPRHKRRRRLAGDQSQAGSQGQADNRGQNIGESIGLYDAIDLLNANRNNVIFETLCKRFAASGVPFDKIWRECLEPVLLRSQARTASELLLEFEQAAQKQPWYSRWFSPGKKSAARPTGSETDAANQAYASRLARNKAAGRRPTDIPYDTKRQIALQQKIDKMNKEIWIPIRMAWARAMNDFKKNIQELQYRHGIDPRTASHTWKLVDMFYNYIMSAAAKFKPPWRRQLPGQTPGYYRDYELARREYQKLQNEIGGMAGAGI